MRSVQVGQPHLRRVAPASAAIVVAGLLVPSCASYFDGPYPCLPGYASCVNPDQHTCETQISSDGLHCGACDTQCAVGAACSRSTCGAAPITLAPLAGQSGPGMQASIAVNSTALFWAEPQGSSIMSIPTSGGTPQPVATNAQNCGSLYFAVDDNNVYYWSNGNSFGATGPTSSGLTQLSLATGVQTMLVPGATGGNPNTCGPLAVNAASVYWQSISPNGGSSSTATVSKVPIGGGAVTMLGMAQGASSGLGVNSTSVVFESVNNGPQQFDVLPAGGGPSSTLQINVNTQGFNGFAIDDANIYVLGSGCGCCSCPNSSNTGGSAPTGAVAKIPLDGSTQTVLVRFSGQAESVAVDATNVYWSTDTGVWAVPITGGASVQLSGNLTGGQAGFLCSGGCGGGSNGGGSNVIAVDATSVYIADTNSAVDAILKVPN